MIKALILGYGFLGKSLIKRLIIEPVPGLLIVGIANSKGYIYSSEGIKLKDLKDKLEENKEFETGRASDLIS
ncbi:MAG: hypothetical protein QXX41_04740, partial [Nitrososphaerota archaeon]